MPVSRNITEVKLEQLFLWQYRIASGIPERLTKIAMATGNVWVDLQSAEKETFGLLRE